MFAEFVACYEASGQVTWFKKFVPGLRVIDSIEKPTLYRMGGVPGLALRGSPPQTRPTETLPDLGLARGRQKAPQRRHDDLADQLPRRRQLVLVEARGTPVPAPYTTIAGPRARRPAPRRLRLPRLQPQLDRRDGSHRHQLVHCTASADGLTISPSISF